MERVFGQKVLVAEIIQYLSVINVWLLMKAFAGQKVNWPTSSVLYQMFYQRILRVLSRFIRMDVLDHLIRNRGFALTGSALLYALTEDETINSPSIGDIDLCHVEDGDIGDEYKGPDLLDVCQMTGVYPRYNDVFHVPPSRHQIHPWGYNFTTFLRLVVNYSHMNTCPEKTMENDMENDKISIQTLCVSDVHDYVLSFDLSVLSNYLDKDRIYIRDPFGIVSRKCTVNLDTYLNPIPVIGRIEWVEDEHLPAKYYRLNKYLDRGFDIYLDQSQISNAAIRFQPSANVHDVFLSDTEIEKIQDDLRITWIKFWQTRVDNAGKLLKEWMSHPEYRTDNFIRLAKKNL